MLCVNQLLPISPTLSIKFNKDNIQIYVDVHGGDCVSDSMSGK